jgi:flagellar biosynthesis protein FlhF
MTIKRYVAATAREAMREVRRDLGDEAVILSNKRVGRQVEILAAAPDAVEALVERSEPRMPAGRGAARATPVAAESFQEFIRRQSQSRATAAPAPRAAAPATAPRAAAPARAGGVQMYNEVAAELPDDGFADADAWATAPRGRADDDLPLPRAATSATVALQPQFEMHLPAAPAAHPAAVAPAPAVSEPQAAPAVFRRRPARSAVPSATVVPTPAPAARGERPASAVASPSPAVAPAVVAPSFAAGAASAAQPSAPQPAGAASVAEPRPMPAAPGAAAAPEPRAVAPAAIAPAAPHASTIAGPGAAAAPTPETPPAPSSHVAAAAGQPQAVAAPVDPKLVAELQAMRALLQEQLAALSSTVAAADAQRRNPLQVRLMTRLLTAGFTPELARCVASNAPPDADGERAERWLHDVIAMNLKCVAEHDGIVERGGVYALVGPTGVGKTTTVAKLAARYAVRYGTSTLGLVTLDAYRIGAHEQLRAYGRILGAPVHLAQDGATLRELLASMQGKRLVLIDTCGISQRDERLTEMMSVLAAASTPARPVARVLLVNAASHAETVDDVARAWRANEAAGAILTKLDEAARIGGALDALLRYKVALFGLTNGQRVPEDWHPANGHLLAHLSLKPAARLFTLADNEGALLAQTAAAARGAAHA